MFLPYYSPMDEQVMTGTTILAIRTPTSVVFGADTRTSMGNFICCRISDKLTRLSDTIYCCRSGSAADTRIIADIVAVRLKSYQFLTNTPLTVERAAKEVSSMCYKYPQLLAGMIVAGYGSDGPRVFSISLGGSLVEVNVAIGGSGSIYTMGYCDEKYRSDFNDEEAVDFVKDVVKMAIRRDNMSGGCIRMAKIDEGGVERYFVPGNEIYE